MGEISKISNVSVSATAAAPTRPEKISPKAIQGEGAAVIKAPTNLDVEFDPIEFNKAVEQIDNFLKTNAKPRMSISVDETLNRPVVQLRDPNGGHVKTIPSEEVIRVSKNIELMKGVFFDAKS